MIEERKSSRESIGRWILWSKVTNAFQKSSFTMRSWSFSVACCSESSRSPSSFLLNTTPFHVCDIPFFFFTYIQKLFSLANFFCCLLSTAIEFANIRLIILSFKFHRFSSLCFSWNFVFYKNAAFLNCLLLVWCQVNMHIYFLLIIRYANNHDYSSTYSNTHLHNLYLIRWRTITISPIIAQ